MKVINWKFQITALAVLAISPALAQVASHAPTAVKTLASANAASTVGPAPSSSMQVTDKPVVRVNDAVLTDRDLLREMLTIFPYARQHNGFPKSEEAKIREGALRMIEFEELVYQEAERRKMTVPAAKLQRAEADFRGQFASQEEFNKYLNTELKGSRELLRRQIRRSLLVDALLKAEVEDKSRVTLTEARSYYDKNPKPFLNNESFSFQSISIMPPDTANDETKKDARKRAEDALRQAKATKSYEEFGLLAEKLSEDDFHVNMGDHKAVEGDKLPPAIVKAALAMKPGEVSDLLQLGNFYSFFRLNAHTPAGKVQFEAVKDRLRKDMEKDKYERLRADLDKRLRKNAKVQEL
jgi:peptidyl-prolyl cis-trans isomerase SurA